MKTKTFYRGQNLVELALLIGIVGLVFIGMGAYIKRGVQGKVKDWTNYVVSDQQAPDADAEDTQSSTSFGSTMTSEELKGGGMKLTGQEKTHVDSSQ